MSQPPYLNRRLAVAPPAPLGRPLPRARSPPPSPPPTYRQRDERPNIGIGAQDSRYGEMVRSARAPGRLGLGGVLDRGHESDDEEDEQHSAHQRYRSPAYVEDLSDSDGPLDGIHRPIYPWRTPNRPLGLAAPRVNARRPGYSDDDSEEEARVHTRRPTYASGGVYGRRPAYSNDDNDGETRSYGRRPIYASDDSEGEGFANQPNRQISRDPYEDDDQGSRGYDSRGFGTRRSTWR